MKKFYIGLALCTSLVYTGCFKGPKEVAPPKQTITSDTLISGNYWAFAIGDNHATIYSKVQDLREEKSINTIFVPNNIFTNLTAIKDKLPLYHTLYLDATQATANGVQLFFENGKVKNIYTNAGQLLNNWPWTGGADNQIIRVENEVSKIYDKLVNIKEMAGYGGYFEKMSLFYKDVKTDYDADMATSNKWVLSSPVSEKVFLRVNIKFNSSAVVDSIMVDRVETE